jgi:hypothetical protein
MPLPRSLPHSALRGATLALKAMSALAILASIALSAVLLLAPAQIVVPITLRLAANEGIILQRLTLGTPWFTLPEDDGMFLLTLSEVEAHFPNGSVAVEDAKLYFSVADIMAGRMTRMEAHEAQLSYQLAPSESPNTALSPTLLFDQHDEMNTLLANLPVDTLRIDSLLAEITDGNASASLATVTADTLALTGGTLAPHLSLNFSTRITPALMATLPPALQTGANVTARGALTHHQETTILAELVTEAPTTPPLLALNIDLANRELSAGIGLNFQQLSQIYPALFDSFANDYGVIITKESLPTIELDLALSEREFSLSNRSSTSFVDAVVTHDLVSNSGKLTLRAALPAFSANRPLSTFIDLSALGFSSQTNELIDGSVMLNADIAWHSWHSQPDAGWAFSGPVTVVISELSGMLGETLFVGANTQLTVEITGSSAPAARFALASSRPTALTIDSLDTGFVLEEASLNYTVNVGPYAVAGTDAPAYRLMASQLRAQFLGGEVSAPEFVISESTAPQNFDLVLTGVDLNTLVQLANTPEVVVNGRISGYLPLNLNPDSEGSMITVRDGLLSALKPGGSIHYTPLGGMASANQSVQLVNEALANYQFSTLDTTLQIDDSGEILFGVALAGANPDMNAGQAINLNVTITDNLLDLVSSLRASRDLTEALERRLAQ